MRAKPELVFDPAESPRLACPVCLGNLTFSSARLVCASCGRAYPVVDGIPVLIAERAEIGRREKISASGASESSAPESNN
jgi:uncharacterized protein YbaR (Trm112 family)